MTKRLSAVVLCLVGVLAFAGVAQAQQPSYTSAQKLAKRLAVNQVRNRSIVSFHVLKGKRTSSGALRFPYDDRSTGNVFCTALIEVRVVTTRGGRIVESARFLRQRCNGIPSDALGFEAAVRTAQRALRSTALATTNAIDRFNTSIAACKRLNVPGSRLNQATTLLDVGQTEALVRPNDQILGNFVTALGQVPTADGVLTAGAAGWTDYLAVLRGLPDVSDPCAALEAWAKHGWTAATAPVDFTALAALERRSTIDTRSITNAANRLGREGVFPTAVVGFTPRGLLLGLAPKIAITGGKGSR